MGSRCTTVGKYLLSAFVYHVDADGAAVAVALCDWVGEGHGGDAGDQSERAEGEHLEFDGKVVRSDGFGRNRDEAGKSSKLKLILL